MKRILLLMALLSLTGCFRLTGIEHEVPAGFGRSQSGGEVFAQSPSGHKDYSGAWQLGTSIKTIWGK